MTGLRPTARRTFSTDHEIGPPSGPFAATVTVPSPFGVTDSTPVFTWTAMPFFRNAFSTSFETSSSSTGRRRGRTSTSTVFEP